MTTIISREGTTIRSPQGIVGILPTIRCVAPGTSNAMSYLSTSQQRQAMQKANELRKKQQALMIMASPEETAKVHAKNTAEQKALMQKCNIETKGSMPQFLIASCMFLFFCYVFGIG